MQSIEIGKFIYEILSENEQLKELLTDKCEDKFKVYPLAVVNEVPQPYIVYRRSGTDSSYSKDAKYQEVTSIELQCIADDYSESIELAKIVLETLDYKKFPSKGIPRIILSDSYEDYIDEAFVQTLVFTIKFI